MIRLLIVFCVLLVNSPLMAQTDPFDADILKMLQVNGSSGTTDAMFGQIVAQLKASKPDVTAEKWAALKKDVFDPAVADLNRQLVPVYKKLFTQEEVKAIIAFYESPAGKKLGASSGQVTSASMPVIQQWAPSLMGKMQTYLSF